MAFITYKQADSRWGKKNYNGSSTMATAGCGPTSCAMIAYGVDGKTTPLDTMKYMQSHGYAIRNNGTAWAGIPNCLKAFGVTNVQEVPNMAKCWELMKQGYVGVFLFRKGSRGGVTWTTSGHYVAVTDYKYQNGKHYVYTRDSGGRNHTGWYAYETTMKGLIPKIWLGKVANITKPTGKYSGTIPSPTIKNGSKGSNVSNLQRFLNWYYPAWKLAVDGDCGNATEAAIRGFQRAEGISADGIYGKQSQGKANAYKVSPSSGSTVATPAPVTKPAASTTNAQKIVNKCNELAWPYGTSSSKWDYKKGSPTSKCKSAMKKHGYTGKGKQSSCAYFCNTVVRESGVNKSFGSLHGYKKAFPKTEKGFNTVHKGKSIPSGFLKPGDVVRYKKKSKDEHVLIYMGNNRICEARHYHRFGNIYKDEKRYNGSNVKKSTIQVLRAK